MTDPQLARSKMKPDCRSKEDWSHLCDYWETDKAQVTFSLFIDIFYVINSYLYVSNHV